MFAQTKRDSISFSTSSFSTNQTSTYFEKQLNTYNLNSHLNYGQKIGDLFIGLQEHFISTVIKTQTRNVKDEHYLNLLGEYNIADVLSFGLLMNSVNYSDDRKLAINKSSNLNSIIYTKLKPLRDVTLLPYGGVSQNKQIGVNDDGFIYGLNGSMTKFEQDEYRVQSNLNFRNEDISPRKNTEREALLELDNFFENNLSNRITGYYSEERKDFYFEADSITSQLYDVTNNIQSRTEQNYFVRDRIAFVSPQRNLKLDFNGRISWRNIDRKTKYVALENISTSSFDTEIEEFKLDFSSSAVYRIGDFNGSARIQFSEREEKHNAKYIDGANQITFDRRQETEQQKNNISQQTTAALTGAFNLSSAQNLSLTLFHRKLKYDTPSDENFDDRDELLTMASITYTNRLNPFFNLFATLEGSLNKIVYIFSERSSNNNTTRVLKLTSGGYYKGSIFRSYNEAEVSANYTVYDFQDLNPNFKSFSFRQLMLKDSTSLDLSRNISFRFFGYLKLSEQGDFNWDKFSGLPSRFLEEKYLEPKVEYRINKIKFGVGLRYFSLLTFTYDQDYNRNLDKEYTSLGPLSEIVYYSFDHLRIKIYGWYEYINNESGNKRELTNLFIQVNWNF